MKLFTAILFSFLLLLPGIGVHLDLTYCCGVIDEIGISHEMEVDMTSCCDDSHKVSCMTESEILQPPTQLDFISADRTNEFSTFIYTAFIHIQSPFSEENDKNQFLFLAQPPPNKGCQALFQVFLC